ncbi:zinc finger protein GIS-like [Phalaenopsis equestris]|uniref:zinc finger protein GIS-like n=1 Tax=Phalaenopsis equestris TaxID=78828 RepID=UPI0009E38701|nr:zinc finger protein GIS-like [Phalaenopsis equestris]
MSNVEEGLMQAARVFSCNYCHRVFTTSQALGGHQNGHRRERELVKRAQRHAQLLANPMHPSLRFTSPYNERSFSFVYGLESAGHHLLTVPLPMMNPNPFYHQPYSLPSQYYGERRGDIRLSRFNEAILSEKMPSSSSTNLEMVLFTGSSGNGDYNDGIENNGRDEEKRDEVDLSLHL